MFNTPSNVQLYSTSDVGTNGVKILAYGGSGVGKTRLAITATAPVIASAESGLLSLRQHKLPYFPVSNIADLWAFHAWLFHARDGWQFQSVFVDSVSEVAEKMLKEAKASVKDPRQAYGKLIDEMIPLVRAFRDLPYRNIIILAKEEYQKEDATGAMLFQPSLPGSKLGPDMPYYFDEVLRLIAWTDQATKQRVSAFQTFRDHQSVAKDRSGALAAYEEPNIAAIVRKITGR